MVWLLKYGNRALALILLMATLSFFMVIYAFHRPSDKININTPSSDKTSSSYAQHPLGKHIFSLKKSSPLISLPSLKGHLSFYGENKRPDAAPSSKKIYLGFSALSSYKAADSDAKIFLSLEEANTTTPYFFSENNTPTPLWMTFSLSHPDALHVKLFMQTPSQDLLIEDTLLPEEAFPKKTSWVLGAYDVSDSLLLLQGASWHGNDLFIERHSEEAHASQRIIFDSEASYYSCSVNEGDALIWDGVRWQTPGADLNTTSHPLMTVEAVNDTHLSFRLWDSSSPASHIFKLHKTTEAWSPFALKSECSFIGSRTKKTCLLSIQEKRLNVSLFDWLLHTKEGWRIIATESDIDGYVEGTLRGELFIIDDIIKRENQNILIGHMFNASRSEEVPVELPLVTASTKDHSTPIEGMWQREEEFSPYDYDTDYEDYNDDFWATDFEA
jgi:hypothetical protein